MKKLFLLILALFFFGFSSEAGGLCYAQFSGAGDDSLNSIGAGDDTLKQNLERAFLNPPYPSAGKRKSQSKALEKLFDKYDDADTDEDEIAALKKIIDYSVKHRQDSALFYALDELFDCYISINYKTADSIYLELYGIVEEYGNPMMTFLMGKDLGRHDTPRFYSRKQKRDFLISNREKLQQRRSDGLYDYLLGIYGYHICIPVVEFCIDDYEYLLWYQFFEEEDDKLLKEYVKGRHPQEEILEVASAISVFQHYASPEKKLQQKLALKGLLRKYEGTFLEFFLRDALLVTRNSEESSQDRQEQYNNCVKFLEDITLAKKKHKSLSSYLQRLEVDVMGEKSRLEKKEVKFLVERGKIRVALNNVNKLDFSILKPGAKVDDKPETVFRKHLKSDKDSFCLYDTLVLDLPKLEDGRYIFQGKAGDKVLGEKNYTQQSISIVLLSTRDGYRLLASDALTGKPLKEYSLRIFETNLRDVESEAMGVHSYNLRKRLFSTTITADTLDAVLLDGEAGKVIADFEKSVESLYDKARDETLALMVSYTDKDGYYRCSPLVPIGRFLPPKSETDIDIEALLMTDNVLYHPKDSLRFKVVAYRGNAYSSFNTLEEGRIIKAILKDAEGNLVDSKELRLGAFGSASSSFFIPEGKKNGRWMMEVSYPVGSGWSLLTRYVRVDDYSLPTYFMEIDPCNTMFKVGDTITVTGKIEGYSGHPLTDADVKMIVEIKDEDDQEYKLVLQRKVQALAGGLVSEWFVPEKSGRYIISFAITDQSGETLGFWTDRFVDLDAWCSHKILNHIKGGKYFLDYKIYDRDRYIINSDTLLLSVDIHPASYGRGISWNIPYKFSIWDINGNEVIQHDNLYGNSLSVDLSSLEDGLYDVEAYFDEPRGDKWDKTRFLLMRESLPDGVESVFIPNDTDDPEASGIDVLVGVSTDVYLTAAVSCGGSVMEHRMIHLDGDRRLHRISFDYPVVDFEEATVGIVYARDGRLGNFKRLYPKKSRTLDLSVQAVEFKDELSPGKVYRFSFKADNPEDMEAVVSAYDASADAILRGYEAEEAKWKTVSLKEPSPNQAFSVYAGAGDFNNGVLDFVDDVLVMGVSRSVGSAAKYVGGALRSDFNEVLCFIPHIVSKDSTISFTVKTSDKLSTYHLNLFAHTRDMHNTFLQKDFKVTIPVKVSISQPSYLYRGDKYDISATVSAKEENAEGAKDGKVVEVYNGQAAIQAYCRDSLLLSYTDNLKLSSGSSSSFNDVVAVGSGVDTIGLKVSYLSDKHSDAVLVKIPVFDNTQKITEAHSAVLLHNSDRAASVAHLKDSFTAMTPDGALEKEETYSDILAGILAKHSTTKDLDIISVMDAFCFSKMASSDLKGMDYPDTLWNNLLSFRNPDGGFAWFKQMRSSQAITAAVLERFALLRDSGYEIPDMTPTLKYLDSTQFEIEWPWWFGLVNSQYLYVRSLYPEVPFKAGRTASSVNNYGRFRTWIRNYLNPPKDNGKRAVSRKAGKQAGFIDFDKSNVLEKASRTVVLRNLMSSEAGRSLIKSWAGKSYSQKALQNTIDKDVFQITDYAVHHPDGGTYYPNAAMPFKGKIENEAYTHSMISDALSGYAGANNSDLGQTASRIADQVRLWLMLQAQTQDWDKNFYFINAVRSMSMASDSIRKTSVLTLSKTEEMPFSQIKASQNGMTVERVFYRDNEILKPGDTLRRGDRIRAEYRIWNKENRSFVKLTAPREACLMPVNQLSGQSYGLKSLMVNNWFEFAPSLYRNVKKDRTEYFFDVLSEEKTVLKEDFYVVQDGVFSAPVVEIESLYAPAYRANDSFKGSLPVERE